LFTTDALVCPRYGGGAEKKPSAKDADDKENEMDGLNSPSQSPTHAEPKGGFSASMDFKMGPTTIESKEINLGSPYGED
jgi:hypothetical protein